MSTGDRGKIISQADKDTTFLSNAQIQPSFHPIYAERFNPNRLLGPARILYNYLLLPSLAPRKKQGYVSFLQIIVQNIKKTFGKKVVILQAERKKIFQTYKTLLPHHSVLITI